MANPQSVVSCGAEPRSISVSALADGGAAEPLLDERGRIHDPLLAIDLDVGDPNPEVVGRAVSNMAGTGRILIGVAARGTPHPLLRPVIAALDLTLAIGTSGVGPEIVGVADPWSAAQALHSAARANPQSSTVLAGLLRSTRALPVAAALDAESFAYSTLLGGPEFRTWLDGRGPRALPPPAPALAVLMERIGDELRITLNRPERRNAYGREVRDALVAALDVALLDENVRVVVAGAGPSFCSGGDLGEFGTTPDLTTAHFVRTRGGAGRVMHRIAQRLEVRVHGSCVGAGIELPAFATRIVADPSATFRLPEVAMGLIPGAGGTVSIPRRIGRWRTLHIALSGAEIGVEEALSWGLIDDVRAFHPDRSL